MRVRRSIAAAAVADHLHILMTGIPAILGAYLGYVNGPPEIFAFGAMLLGLLIAGTAGMNVWASLFPSAYIRYWRVREGFGPWSICLLPATGLLSCFLLVEPARSLSVISYRPEFWHRFVVACALSVPLAVIRLIVCFPWADTGSGRHANG